MENISINREIVNWEIGEKNGEKWGDCAIVRMAFEFVRLAMIRIKNKQTKNFIYRLERFYRE